MRWQVRCSDGTTTIIEADEWMIDKSCDGPLAMFTRKSTVWWSAVFAPGSWKSVIRLDPKNPVEVGLQTLSPEFTPATPNTGETS